MRRTDEIAQAYRQTFGQESVLRTVTTACVFFLTTHRTPRFDLPSSRARARAARPDMATSRQ